MIEVHSRCDITKMDTEAIVNAANSHLLRGAGVDGAIHRAAGPRLLQATRKIGGCLTGEARLTPGFGLPARWIIHAVGPVWQGGARGEPELLARTYTSVMVLAGSEGIPVDRAARNQYRSLWIPERGSGPYCSIGSAPIRKAI